MKRAISVLLAVLLCVGILPTVVFAASVPTYTVILEKTGSNIYTVTVTAPKNTDSGKIVISTGTDLTIVGGSLKGYSGGVTNEDYSKDDINGACVSFASNEPFTKDTVVFEARYTAKSGAIIDLDDVTAPEWNLGKEATRVSSQDDCDVIKKLVESTLGDVNGDDYIDNIDAALLLKHDAGLIPAPVNMETAGDVNFDGCYDNMDAALILKYDAGLITMFCSSHVWSVSSGCGGDVCTECGLTRGGADHKWVAADCDTPKTCSKCGKTEGTSLGHDWKAADCDTPKTCKRCGATSGSATGDHNYVNGVCTGCGKKNNVSTPSSALTSLRNFIRTNGIMSSTGDYIYGSSIGDSLVIFSYTPGETSVEISWIAETSSDEALIQLTLTSSSTSHDFLVGVADYYGDIYAGISGYIKPSSYNGYESQLYGLDYFPIGSLSALKGLAVSGLKVLLIHLDAVASRSGLSLDDFGYTSFTY